MESQDSRSPSRDAQPWIGLGLCVALVSAWVVEHLVPNRPTYAQIFAPDWLPPVAAGLAGAGFLQLNGPPFWLRARGVFRWGGLLLVVWAANGLPLDVLRVIGLIPFDVDWWGLATRALALVTAVVLARLLSSRPASLASTRAATWYGYAAFVLAWPYPVLRTHWALGGTVGLLWPGAAGEGFVAWAFSIPWLLAAALSLFLVVPPRWIPRRLLLAAGWSATAVVAMIGPAGCWALITEVASGSDTGFQGIELWVPGLFYASWLLWAIAAGAATRSYQLRSLAPPTSAPP